MRRDSFCAFPSLQPRSHKETVLTSNCFWWGEENVFHTWFDYRRSWYMIWLHIFGRDSGTVTWKHPTHFRVPLRFQTPSSGTITYGRCLTHTWEAVHSESINFVPSDKRCWCVLLLSLSKNTQNPQETKIPKTHKKREVKLEVRASDVYFKSYKILSSCKHPKSFPREFTMSSQYQNVEETDI